MSLLSENEAASSPKVAKEVSVGQAIETDSAGTVRALVKARLWVTWATIAFERNVEAGIARANDDTISWEARASLQTVTAVAFALQNLAQEVKDATDIEIAEKYDNSTAFVYDVLNKGFRFGKLVGSGELPDRLKEVIDSRDVGVHHSPEFRDVVDHPTGVRTAQENRDYSVERAERAVETLALVLETCVRCSRAETQEWVAQVAGSIDALLKLRGVGPSPSLLDRWRDRDTGWRQG